MSNQQIRPVIECLCQIFSSCGFSLITPEIFRLAKFNRNEATKPLWRLIYEILHSNQSKVNFSKFDQIPKDDLLTWIKSELFTRGYTYENFLRLDHQMKKGSRQLLLCLGWLIYHLKFIEHSIHDCLKSQSIFDYDDTSSLYQNEFPNETFFSQEKDLIRQIKQAMKVNSKLRFTLRRLHGLVIENANLQHQIHECHNMSSLEAHLCQHPHLLSHYSIELENEQKKLNSFLFWNEHEDVFWKWMESVLDQATPTEDENEDEEEENEDKYESLTSADCQRFEVEKQKFNSAIDTLDSALARLQQIWISNNDHTSIEHNVSSLVASIDTQVSSLFHQLLATNPSSISSISPSSDQSIFLHQPYRLVYTKTSDRNELDRLIKPSDFDRETSRLNTLQIHIDQQIEKQRNILDTLSHQFENVMIV